MWSDVKPRVTVLGVCVKKARIGTFLNTVNFNLLLNLDLLCKTVMLCDKNVFFPCHCPQCLFPIQQLHSWAVTFCDSTKEPQSQNWEIILIQF